MNKGPSGVQPPHPPFPSLELRNTEIYTLAASGQMTEMGCYPKKLKGGRLRQTSGSQEALFCVDGMTQAFVPDNTSQSEWIIHVPACPTPWQDV